MRGLRRFFGSGRRPWHEAVYWALDLETSGLDPRREEILSVGMVPIRAGGIRWGERFASLVQPVWPGAALGDGLPAHHLLPGEVAGGLTLAAALEQILLRLDEGVLLVHFAALDVELLRRACAACGRKWPKPPVVDTVRLLEHMAQVGVSEAVAAREPRRGPGALRPAARRRARRARRRPGDGRALPRPAAPAARRDGPRARSRKAAGAGSAAADERLGSDDRRDPEGDAGAERQPAQARGRRPPAPAKRATVRVSGPVSTSKNQSSRLSGLRDRRATRMWSAM